jgi:hypothetical protein
MATQTTPAARARAYAKSMAMPGIREWTKHVTGDNRFFSIEFEGRDYFIERVSLGATPWGLSVRTPAIPKERLTPGGGRYAGKFRQLGDFATTAKAVAAARKFAEVEGWPSGSRKRSSRRSRRH